MFLLLTATAFYKMYTGISCQKHLDASTQTSADISCKTNAGISADEAVNIPSPFGIGRGTALGLLALAAGWCFLPESAISITSRSITISVMRFFGI